MKTKLVSSLFYDELDKLRDIINQIAASNSGSGDKPIAPLIPSGPSLSSKELAEFKEALKKFAEFEEKLKLLDQILQKIGKMNDELAKKADKVWVDAEFKKTNGQVEKLFAKCDELEELIR
jgi:hypothetical protein